MYITETARCVFFLFPWEYSWYGNYTNDSKWSLTTVYTRLTVGTADFGSLNTSMECVRLLLHVFHGASRTQRTSGSQTAEYRGNIVKHVVITVRDLIVYAVRKC